MCVEVLSGEVLLAGHVSFVNSYFRLQNLGASMALDKLICPVETVLRWIGFVILGPVQFQLIFEIDLQLLLRLDLVPSQ